MSFFVHYAHYSSGTLDPARFHALRIRQCVLQDLDQTETCIFTVISHMSVTQICFIRYNTDVYPNFSIYITNITVVPQFLPNNYYWVDRDRAQVMHKVHGHDRPKTGTDCTEVTIVRIHVYYDYYGLQNFE